MTSSPICSFCGATVSDSAVMITGNGEACICDRCTEEAIKIIDRKKGRTGVGMLRSSSSSRRRKYCRAPSEHQVAVLEELLRGGYIGEGTPAGRRRGWHLVDREGIVWREAIRSTTIDKLFGEQWIERPDDPAVNGGEHRWSISAAGRLALARARTGDFGLVVLRGGKA